MKRYLAELIGTFALALTVALSLVHPFAVATPVLAGLVLALFVYTVGHISGAHINPAITFGAWSIGKIKLPEALGYWLMQFIGGGLALMAADSLGNGLPAVQTSGWLIGLAEAAGAFFFAFGVAAVIYKKVDDVMSGLVVGGSLLLGITLATLLGSSGFVNPAVAFAAKSLDWMYCFGPLVGAALGMWSYRLLMQSPE